MMPEKAASGPGARQVHVLSGSAKRSSKEGYNISGILLHSGLDLAVQLAPFLHIHCGIGLIQNGLELFVTIVRFVPFGTAAERQVHICSRRNPSIPATDGKRPLHPLVPKGRTGKHIDFDDYAGLGCHLFIHLGEGRTKIAVWDGELEFDTIGMARLSQQRFGLFDVLPLVRLGVGALGGITGLYPVVVGHPAHRLDEGLYLFTILDQLEGFAHAFVIKGCHVAAHHDGRNPAR